MLLFQITLATPRETGPFSDSGQPDATKQLESQQRLRFAPHHATEGVATDRSARFPGHSRVRVELTSGRIIEGRYDIARGHPGKPLSWSELVDKFRDCAALVLPKKKAEEAVELIARMNELKSLTPLLRALSGASVKRIQSRNPGAESQRV
jgi:hypothetical protein